VIAQSLGYSEEYNKGQFLFKKGEEECRVSLKDIRSRSRYEAGTEQELSSMERLCTFFDRERALSEDYKDVLSEKGFSIIQWQDETGNPLEDYNIIDHEQKISYTSGELYAYTMQNGYQLDGEGTQLDPGTYSEMTTVNGKRAKIRMSENGVSIYYRKEALVIPKKVLGKKLSTSQQKSLLDGDVIVLSTRKGDIYLQVDRELNSVVVRSERELGIPSQIGGYELTSADKCLWANGHTLESKLLLGDEGYFIADVSRTADGKGFSFTNIQTVSPAKAHEILHGHATARDLEGELKSALEKGDFEKVAKLKEEGYSPSEEVINQLELSDDKRAVVMEKLFGVKSEVEANEMPAEIEGSVEAAQEKTVEPLPLDKDEEFKFAVEKGDFEKLVVLKEQGYKPEKKLMQVLSTQIPENSFVAVQKIFGLKASPKSIVGEVKMPSKTPPSGKDISRSAGAAVNKIFNDL
jgi:hypothetical protein